MCIKESNNHFNKLFVFNGDDDADGDGDNDDEDDDDDDDEEDENVDDGAVAAEATTMIILCVWYPS